MWDLIWSQFITQDVSKGSISGAGSSQTSETIKQFNQCLDSAPNMENSSDTEHTCTLPFALLVRFQNAQNTIRSFSLLYVFISVQKQLRRQTPVSHLIFCVCRSWSWFQGGGRGPHHRGLRLFWRLNCHFVKAIQFPGGENRRMDRESRNELVNGAT